MELPFVRPFDIIGKPMRGWVMVEKQGFETEKALNVWLDQARQFVSALPHK